MDMFNENVVLCASSAYEKKFYLNEAFDKLPEEIKNYVCAVYRGSRRHLNT